MPTPAPLTSFLRASSLHVGAAAAAASLRHDLIDDGSVAPADFDAAFAVARLTPGTNLLALYALRKRQNEPRTANWLNRSSAVIAL